MPIAVSCACGKQFSTPDRNAGRSSRCPECGRSFVIPRAKVEKPEAPTTNGFADPHALVEFAGVPTSDKAITSLILGVLSLVLIFFAGVPAILFGWQGLQEVKRGRGRVRGRGVAAAGMMLGAVGSTAVSYFVMVPIVNFVWENSRSTECESHLKEVGRAIHDFESAYDVLPPHAITDKAGRPLLSWRVAILPHLGKEGLALFQKFHVDEPWDSPHNRPLADEMPAVYACPSSVPSGSKLTNYQVVVGPRTMFSGGRRGVKLSTITDGTTNTLMVAEAARPVVWTAPDDLSFNPSATMFGMGSGHPGGFYVVFGDGSFRFVKRSVSPGVIAAVTTRDGGENVTVP